MSKMGNHRIELQEMPEYMTGYKSRVRGNHKIRTLVNANASLNITNSHTAALILGWDDADRDLTNEPK